MKILWNNRGFSLIELLITAVIINILAGVAIVAYIGTQEKARISQVIRTASSASADLHLWINSSLSDKKNLREIDTNLDGKINSSDKTNGELLTAGVAKTYINARSIVYREHSPWFDLKLWNEDDPPTNGTISLRQPSNNQLIIIAKEKNGITVYKNIIFAN
ncbi:MAG: prepilin-type N-terminal cleavage/methylation domain-containing protein [Nitrospirae bacterium]|nr:prepilin-type N-terminal cleavage/methylation domain-containing protein [Nitrospirota bacterium]